MLSLTTKESFLKNAKIFNFMRMGQENNTIEVMTKASFARYQLGKPENGLNVAQAYLKNNKELEQGKDVSLTLYSPSLPLSLRDSD